MDVCSVDNAGNLYLYLAGEVSVDGRQSTRVCIDKLDKPVLSLS